VNDDVALGQRGNVALHVFGTTDGIDVVSDEHA
jgi:hypothetical protein